jgi:hypothetical protein
MLATGVLTVIMQRVVVVAQPSYEDPTQVKSAGEDEYAEAVTPTAEHVYQYQGEVQELEATEDNTYAETRDAYA